MPIATPDQYLDLIARAKAGGYAYPAINVTSSQTLNAALQGLSEAKSDGIIQVTMAGAAHIGGHTRQGKVAGAIALARFAREVAKNYPVTVALHTDHCPLSGLDSFLLPLLEAGKQELIGGGRQLFQSHMWDGSALPIERNIEISQDILRRTRELDAVLEIEVGAVGGQEDGVEHRGPESELYTNPGDVVRVVEALSLGQSGPWMAALTFGNVHGVTDGVKAKLRPELLGDIQSLVASLYGTDQNPLDLVFHGGSGCTDAEIAASIGHGVVKVNIDTDTQYAFTRAIADWILRNYDGVLKIDGNSGSKQHYQPHAWGAVAENSMAARVAAAARTLGSAGQSVGGGALV
ncbi:class II fructose-bisphosphate aldolase [Mycolicibacterium goodii]|uniref:class II fructose-bisphosphate aldolase n=1 Tax=Mycolicibacterium goodii TaxID=134601 RepID=UPI000C256BC2|nr:class II fructose-bisphosphate aldolase [Mycolicibacterium goodii]PJK18253.1 class II fructose-bisphosphate aldolase [Mycolicibacterium goodii]